MPDTCHLVSVACSPCYACTYFLLAWLDRAGMEMTDRDNILGGK